MLNRKPLTQCRLARAIGYLWERMRRKGPMPHSMEALILLRMQLRLAELADAAEEQAIIHGTGGTGLTKEEWIIPAPGVPLNFTVVQDLVIREPRMMFVGKIE